MLVKTEKNKITKRWSMNLYLICIEAEDDER